jgi:hypothetical protein
MCCVRARCRPAAGPAYLWPNTLLVSGVALPQSFAGQYFSECYGVWAPVPRGVLAEPDRNTAALSGARRARLAWGVGALSAAIFSLENDGDRSGHLCQCCRISDLLSMTPYLALARSAPAPSPPPRPGEADVSSDRLSPSSAPNRNRPTTISLKRR